jgi:ribosome biogenesis protein BMS1
MEAADVGGNKVHRARQAGAKADKRKEAIAKKRASVAEGTSAAVALANNKKAHKDTRAFGVAKFGRLHKTQQRNQDRSHRKEHAPLVDRGVEVPPPLTVVVMGPRGSGKSTLIKVHDPCSRLLVCPSRFTQLICAVSRQEIHAPHAI